MFKTLNSKIGEFLTKNPLPTLGILFATPTVIAYQVYQMSGGSLLISSLSGIASFSITSAVVRKFIDTFSNNDFKNMFNEISNKTGIDDEKIFELLSTTIEKSYKEQKEENSERMIKRGFIDKITKNIGNDNFGKIPSQHFSTIREIIKEHSSSINYVYTMRYNQEKKEQLKEIKRKELAKQMGVSFKEEQPSINS